MATSLSDVRERLKQALDNPTSHEEFARWLGLAMMEVREDQDPDVAHLLYAVHAAFSYANDGSYTKEDLRATLKDLAEEPASAAVHEKLPASRSVVATWQYEVENLPYDPSLGAGPVYFGYFEGAFQSSSELPSVSGAFYSQVPTSPQLSAADKAQPTAWETVIVQEPDREPLAA
jgi:hypothetical protein